MTELPSAGGRGAAALTPMRAVRQKCLDCCCGSATEVRLCPAQDCPLWRFRDGHNPARAGIGRKHSAAEKARSRGLSEREEANCAEK